jgi:putative phosphoribosyl transferase
MAFPNRREAGRRLAEKLRKYAGRADAIVLALPRGGVPVGYEVARALAVPLDVLLVRKLGAPHQPELAIGAVVDGQPPDVILNEDIIHELGLTEAAIEAESCRQLDVIEARRKAYGRPPEALAGRSVIVVDDGAATGATLRVALKGVRRRQPARLIAAVPVASAAAARLLQQEADEVVCLEAPGDFGAVGFYYHDFAQVSDAEVIAILHAFASANAA